MVVVEALQVAILALPMVGLALTFGYIATRLMKAGARFAHRARTASTAPTHPGPAPPPAGLARLVRPRHRRRAEVPGGGAVDYFGFGLGGELILFGAAATGPARRWRPGSLPPPEQLGSFSADKLDRLLLDGPPFTEAVADGGPAGPGAPGTSRPSGADLDDTLARRDFRPDRAGRVTDVSAPSIRALHGAKCNKTVKIAANRHECQKVVQ